MGSQSAEQQPGLVDIELVPERVSPGGTVSIFAVFTNPTQVPMRVAFRIYGRDPEGVPFDVIDVAEQIPMLTERYRLGPYYTAKYKPGRHKICVKVLRLEPAI